MPRAILYDRLPTEQRHPASHELDRLATHELLRLMHRENARAVRAVERRLPQIVRAIRLIVAALRRNGRLFFLGAGTSGRLGVLEAAECPPTFRTDPSMVQAIIAGGPSAVFRSREGTEDDRASGGAAVRRRLRRQDVLVGIAASGVTPFVDEALRAARRMSADTILITCDPSSSILADVRIVLEVGPEILAGSTRLKAGTATKLVLNMLTLGAMVRLGKTYGNLMVDVRPTSRKLRARAVRIIQSVTGAPAEASAAYLRTARGDAKAAILMAAQGLPYPAAARALARAQGSLRVALRWRARRRARRAPHPPAHARSPSALATMSPAQRES